MSNDVVGMLVFTCSRAKQGSHQRLPGHAHNPHQMLLSAVPVDLQQRATQLPVNPAKPNHLLSLFLPMYNMKSKESGSEDNLAQRALTAEVRWG